MSELRSPSSYPFREFPVGDDSRVKVEVPIQGCSLREHGSSETKNWTRGRENLGVAILKQATNVMIQIVWKKLKLIAVSYKIWRRFSFKTTPLNDFCIGKSINPLSLTNSS